MFLLPSISKYLEIYNFINEYTNRNNECIGGKLHLLYDF